MEPGAQLGVVSGDDADLSVEGSIQGLNLKGFFEGTESRDALLVQAMPHRPCFEQEL
jgi:hypothetical protein